MNIFEY